MSFSPGSFGGATTPSTTSSRPRLGSARRTTRRISAAGSSFQPCRCGRGGRRPHRRGRSREVPPDRLAAVGQTCGPDPLLRVRRDLGQVEHDPTQASAALQQGQEQRAVAAADVDDGLALLPGVRGEQVGERLLAAGHEAVEAGPRLRIRRQIALVVGPEGGIEGRLPALHRAREPGEGRVELLPEDEREVPEGAGLVAQELALLRVGKAPLGLLDEDAVRGEHAQEPVEGIRVRADGVRELARRARPAREQVRDSELRRRVDRLAEHEAHDPPGELAARVGRTAHNAAAEGR
jgi:hypothetical protein